MTEAEAAALLDSLRGKETLLPFNNQARGKRSGDNRDWYTNFIYAPIQIHIGTFPLALSAQHER